MGALFLAILTSAAVLAVWGFVLFSSATSSVPTQPSQGRLMFFGSKDGMVTFPRATVSLPELRGSTYKMRIEFFVGDAVTGPSDMWAVAITRPTQIDTTKPLTSCVLGDDESGGGSGLEFELTQGEMDGGVAEVIWGPRPQVESFSGGLPVCLEFSLRRPVVLSSGSQFVTNLPELGQTKNQGDDQPAFLDAPGAAEPANIWQRPRQSVVLQGQTVGDVITSTRELSSSTRPTDWTWSSDETGLLLQALVVRPSAQSALDRRNFFAGVLVSVAVSLVLWAAEIAFGPERIPLFTGLDERPLRPAGDSFLR